LQAKVEDARGGDFHHLHFQHHLGVGLVLRLQQLFGHAHGVGGVTHGQGIEAFVDEHVTGLEHGLDHVQRGVGVDAGQVEGAHDQFLVVLGLLRRIGVDQQGIVVDDLLPQLVLLQQQRHGVLDAHVTHEDGGLHVRAQVLVEDEVDAGDLRQHLEDGLQAGVAKLQGDRALQLAAQLRVRRCSAGLDVLDVGAQGHALLVLWVQAQHFAHVALGAEQVALAQRSLAQRDTLVEGADQLQMADAFLGTAVVRLEGQHPAVAGAGAGEVMADAVGIRLADQRFHRGLATVGQGDVQLRVARVLAQGLFQAGNAGLVLALLHQLGAVLAHPAGAAAGNGHAQRQEHERSRLARFRRLHGALPTDKVCD